MEKEKKTDPESEKPDLNFENLAKIGEKMKNFGGFPLFGMVVDKEDSD